MNDRLIAVVKSRDEAFRQLQNIYQIYLDDMQTTGARIGALQESEELLAAQLEQSEAELMRVLKELAVYRKLCIILYKAWCGLEVTEFEAAEVNDWFEDDSAAGDDIVDIPDVPF